MFSSKCRGMYLSGAWNISVNNSNKFKYLSMKLKLLKATCLPFVLFLFILASTGCKKDKLEVKEVKEYLEIRQVAAGDLAGGAMHLTLKPDGNADITPGGDISYRGAYRINGSTIKVKTEEDSYSFEIISETEIKSKEFGTILNLIIQGKL